MTYSVGDAKSDLNNIPIDFSLFERMLEVSAIITKIMAEHVNESDMPIIVGGLSLEIYTESEYTTHDIDLVTSASVLIEEKLLEIGFVKEGRLYQYKRLNVAVDIVDSNLDPPDYNRVIKLEIADNKYVYVQSIENILYDRALDYERSDNREYSIYLISTRYDDIDFTHLKNRLGKVDSKALYALEEWVRIASGK